MQPLHTLPPAALKQVSAVLTDIDDTLTTHGRLPAVAYAALEQLTAAGIAVVPVTGRPAGWCDMIARFWPVAGVIGENGAMYFRYDAQEKKMHRVYAQTPGARKANAAKLMDLAQTVMRDFPGTALAADQAYREIDVAIDFCEDVSTLPLSIAQEIAARFHAAGAEAKVSSIHVNAWFGTHDKLTMAKRFLGDVLNLKDEQWTRTVVYAGDSPNDAPMFGFFPLSVGVANVRPYVKMMPHLPAYVTNEEGGQGFAALADALLRAKLK
jgi:HAD superfamily hydrolase (TIGR01484 family)